MKDDYKIIETERLILKPFSTLSDKQKVELADSFENPFNARFNLIENPNEVIEEITTRKEPTFSIFGKSFESFKDTNYFRVAFNKKTNELIGVCRFGVYYELQKENIWDCSMGNILLKHWGKGYGVEILKGVRDFAKQQGVKFLYIGANKDNFASYHAMIKSGLKFSGIDTDGDFEYKINLKKQFPSLEEMEEEWQKHIKRYLRKFGKKRYNRLSKINLLIKEMVKRIQSGEDEEKLVKEYFEKCNKIEEFPMC